MLSEFLKGIFGAKTRRVRFSKRLIRGGSKPTTKTTNIKLNPLHSVVKILAAAGVGFTSKNKAKNKPKPVTKKNKKH
jgi:hypothetical protein